MPVIKRCQQRDTHSGQKRSDCASTQRHKHDSASDQASKDETAAGGKASDPRSLPIGLVFGVLTRRRQEETERQRRPAAQNGSNEQVGYNPSVGEISN